MQYFSVELILYIIFRVRQMHLYTTVLILDLPVPVQITLIYHHYHTLKAQYML